MKRVCELSHIRMVQRVAWGVFIVASGLILAACGVQDNATRYQNIAAWITENTLPSELVAAPASVVRYITDRPTVRLSETVEARELLSELQMAQPDVVVAWHGVAWDGVRTQPWFSDHYRFLTVWNAPNTASGPLRLWEYHPSPFVGGTLRVVDPIPGVPSFPLRAVRVNHTRLTPGEPLYVALIWTGDLLVAADAHRLVLALVDADGSFVRAQFEEVLVDGLPAGLLRESDDVVSRYTLAVPGDLLAGAYTLTLSLSRLNGEPIGAEAVPLIALHRPSEVTWVRPVSDFEGVWHLGETVTLVGYDVPERLSPDDSLRMALYWYARETVPVDAKVFVHLLNAEGALEAQSDGKPVWWTYPTTQWEPGQYIRDEHIVEADAVIPRGDYTLVVGMYDAVTGERLGVTDVQGQVLPDNVIPLRVVKVR